MVGKTPRKNARPGVDEYGRTQLHYEANEGNGDAVSALLNQGANVNAQDDKGMCALHFAAQSGHHGIIQLLLEAKANPNLVDAHGNGPLWTATMNARGNFESVKALLEAGANPIMRNKHGRSPIDMANTIKQGLEKLYETYMA